MTDHSIKAILSFLKSAEPLKDTLRTSHTTTGRRESTAEHTWRLCLLALLLEDYYPDLDFLKVLKTCIIHDLGEAISGDIPATDQTSGPEKNIQERKDIQKLTMDLPVELQSSLLHLWDDYDSATSQEAQLVKALDKLETILQHTQGKNPPEFDYAFNLSYGKAYTDYDSLTKKLRSLLDQETEILSQQEKDDPTP